MALLPLSVFQKNKEHEDKIILIFDLKYSD